MIQAMLDAELRNEFLLSTRRFDKARKPFIFIDGFLCSVAEPFEQLVEPGFVVDKDAGEEHRCRRGIFADDRQDAVDDIFVDVGQNQVVALFEVDDQILFGIEEFDLDLIGLVFRNVFNGVFSGPGVVVEGEDGAVVAEFAGGYSKNAGASADVHDFFLFEVEMLHLAQHQACCGVVAGAERHLRVDLNDDLSGFWRDLIALLNNQQFVGDFDGLQGCLPIGIPVSVGDEGCCVSGKRAQPFLQH